MAYVTYVRTCDLCYLCMCMQRCGLCVRMCLPVLYVPHLARNLPRCAPALLCAICAHVPHPPPPTSACTACHRYADKQALLTSSDAKLAQQAATIAALQAQLQEATGAAGRSQKQRIRELEQQVCLGSAQTWLQGVVMLWIFEARNKRRGALRYKSMHLLAGLRSLPAIQSPVRMD